MIKLDDFRQLNLVITWRLLFLGVYYKQIKVEEAIEYAREKFEKGDERGEVCELAWTRVDENETICNLLWKLAEQENTQSDFESRKIRAAIVHNALKLRSEDYLEGLMTITDLWVELGYPKDSPHVIQGRDNCIIPSEYYTIDNYNYLYEKNRQWLISELKYLASHQ